MEETVFPQLEACVGPALRLLGKISYCMEVIMNSRLLSVACLLFSFLLVTITSVCADEIAPIQLPQPQMDGGKPLMQTLQARKTTREFAADPLPMQTLSNLLWAAWGINRPDSGRRTAPSALNRQEMDVYVFLAAGGYLYDAKANSLVPVASGDIRAMTGTQDWVKASPLDLVYVADFARMSTGEEAQKMVLAAFDTGYISENVYLFCASEGLGTGFRVSIDKPKLAELMKLRPDQKIMGAQSIGLMKTK
jgi:nitroreductase